MWPIVSHSSLASSPITTTISRHRTSSISTGQTTYGCRRHFSQFHRSFLLLTLSGDILIERWIPYGPQAKRRTIIQRAPLSPPYPPPRNLIILYDPTPVRMVRQFRRFDPVQADPRAYLSRYGSSLLDTDTLIRTARAAGVTEDTVNDSQRFSSPIIEHRLSF